MRVAFAMKLLKKLISKKSQKLDQKNQKFNEKKIPPQNEPHHFASINCSSNKLEKIPTKNLALLSRTENLFLCHRTISTTIILLPSPFFYFYFFISLTFIKYDIKIIVDKLYGWTREKNIKTWKYILTGWMDVGL